MSWASFLVDFRTLLSDGDIDKLAYRKTIVGIPNSSNKVFKTFDWRRVTNLTTATAPLGVYVNGAIATIDSDDVTVGEFSFHTAPGPNDTLEASYYYQWFKDSELTTFMTFGVQWLTLGSDPNIVPDGLKPATLNYAAHLAYKNLISKWSTNWSNIYRGEDKPDQNKNSVMKGWADQAEAYFKDATAMRDQYYRRAGQALSPNTGVLIGAVNDVVPRR